MLCVADGLTEGGTVGCKYPHAFGHIRRGFRFLCKLFGEPVGNSRHETLVAHGFRAEFLHDGDKPWSDDTASNRNTTTICKKSKAHLEEWSVITTDDSSIVSKIILSIFGRSLNGASFVQPAEVWHAPVDIADYFRWTAEAGR